MNQYRQLTSSINRILADNQSGSGTLLSKLFSVLDAFALNNTIVNAEKFLATWKPLHDKFYPFAAIIHFIEYITRSVKSRQTNLDSKILLESVRDYKSNRKKAIQMVSEKFLKEINAHGKSILIHSNSSAIADIFRRAANAGSIKGIRIYQTISYPAMEGILMANKLAGMGYHITLIHEMDAPRFIGKIDFAISGADCILDDYFINKTGTYFLAMLFRKNNKPFYSIADRTKVFNGKKYQKRFLQSLTRNEKTSHEIPCNRNKKISVKNFCLEAVPNQMVSNVWS